MNGILTFLARFHSFYILTLSPSKKKKVLWTMEKALRYKGISAVIAEIDFAQSKRLQLATEESKLTRFILRNTTEKISATSCAARL